MSLTLIWVIAGRRQQVICQETAALRVGKEAVPSTVAALASKFLQETATTVECAPSPWWATLEQCHVLRGVHHTVWCTPGKSNSCTSRTAIDPKPMPACRLGLDANIMAVAATAAAVNQNCMLTAQFISNAPMTIMAQTKIMLSPTIQSIRWAHPSKACIPSYWERFEKGGREAFRETGSVPLEADPCWWPPTRQALVGNKNLFPSRVALRWQETHSLATARKRVKKSTVIYLLVLMENMKNKIEKKGQLSLLCLLEKSAPRIEGQ